MDGERILSRKLEKLDRLKMALVSRGDMDKAEIVEGIIEVEEDLEAILMDLGYINEVKSEEEVVCRTYKRYRDIFDE